MKQLKFMLAAATALGLATASQATDYGSDNFESYDIGLFPYEGASDLWQRNVSGNASEIVADNSNAGLDAAKYTKGYPVTTEHTKALSVDTTDTPLLKYFELNSESKPKTIKETVFIDTMVQFTVTQEGQEPDLDNLDEENKLMLYAKTNTVGETKLFAVAAEFQVPTFIPGSSEPVPGTGKCDVQSWETDANVNPGIWYRLTVKAYSVDLGNGVDYINLFKIWVDGTEVKVSKALYLSAPDDTTLFPSIQGATATAGVTAVGFAGQGMVDDLVMTTDDPEVGSLDFTFTWSKDGGITGVSYTIGDGTPSAVETDGEVKLTVAPKSSFTINVTLADWYKLAAGTQLTYNNVTQGATVALAAELVTSASDLGVTMTIPEGTTATEADILAWAKAAEATTDDVKGAVNIVANYLLNVTDLAVEPKIEIVEVKPATDTTPMTITAKVTDAEGTVIKDLTTGNINDTAAIKYKAAATLELFKTADLKDEIEDGDKFVQVVVE